MANVMKIWESDFPKSDNFGAFHILNPIIFIDFGKSKSLFCNFREGYTLAVRPPDPSGRETAAPVIKASSSLLIVLAEFQPYFAVW